MGEGWGGMFSLGKCALSQRCDVTRAKRCMANDAHKCANGRERRMHMCHRDSGFAKRILYISKSGLGLPLHPERAMLLYYFDLTLVFLASVTPAAPSLSLAPPSSTLTRPVQLPVRRRPALPLRQQQTRLRQTETEADRPTERQPDTDRATSTTAFNDPSPRLRQHNPPNPQPPPIYT